jgi:hypothetical protein
MKDLGSVLLDLALAREGKKKRRREGKREFN